MKKKTIAKKKQVSPTNKKQILQNRFSRKQKAISESIYNSISTFHQFKNSKPTKQNFFLDVRPFSDYEATSTSSLKNSKSRLKTPRAKKLV